MMVNLKTDSKTDVKVTPDPIALSDVNWESLRTSGDGACNIFTGAVRNRNHGREVRAVEYDAFVPLAEKILAEIARESLKKAGGSGSVYLRHRTGRLEVGEVSVLIVVHTPHRAEAFAVCRRVIEELKVRVPIWKKEYYSDGESGWLQGHALCAHGAAENEGDSSHA
jgi:molybdopterin synthase catalytic subunit